MTYVFQLRRGLAAEWTTDNPVLRAGEPGFESDTNKLKIGDGVQSWNTLEYFIDAEAIALLIEDAAGAVVSVYGRTGAVTAQTGDYTKAQVGLSNVDNTSDLNKPISTATQTALDGKSGTGHSHAPTGPTITVSGTAPSSPSVGDVWIDTSA